MSAASTPPASTATDATRSPTLVTVSVLEVKLELDSEQSTLHNPSPPPESTPTFPSPTTTSTTALKASALARFWRSLISTHSPRPPAHICHGAFTLYSVLSGNTSAAPTGTSPSSRRLSKAPPAPLSPPSHPLNPSTPAPPPPQVTLVEVERSAKGSANSRVSKNAVKRLKSDLLHQRKAVRIVKDIRTIDSPDGSARPKAYALRVLPTDNAPPSPASEPAFTLISIPNIPFSKGAVAGLAGAKSGAFDLAAGATGALLSKIDQGGIVAPLDRMAVFIFWWGFEMTLPPPVLTTLNQVHSVSNTLFTFLQAFVVSGGAPELAPFVKYLSSYVDMEWSAIQSQNKGHGVVLAATWLLPVALVPRPWDFPLPSPPTFVVSPPEEDDPAPTLAPVEVGVVFPLVQVA